jgi:hypothetical protein
MVRQFAQPARYAPNLKCAVHHFKPSYSRASALLCPWAGRNISLEGLLGIHAISVEMLVCLSRWNGLCCKELLFVCS